MPAGGEETLTLEALQKLVRDHWHRGIFLLERYREEAGGDFKAFVDILVRKANLPEQGDTAPLSTQLAAANLETKELGTEAARNTLLQHCGTVGVSAEIRETLAGPRINRYKLFSVQSQRPQTLESHLDEFEAFWVRALPEPDRCARTQNLLLRPTAAR